MADPVLVRSAGLLIPVGVTLCLVQVQRPDRRVGAAAFLGSLWVFVWILPVNLLALRFGWWSFEAHGGLFFGTPVDLWLGWALLWGAVPLLAFPRVPVWVLVAASAFADLTLMPLSGPVVQLGSGWLRGEVVGIVFCLVPAQVLGRWTREGCRLATRTTAQMVLFASISLWLIPSVILAKTGGCWCLAMNAAPWVVSLELQLVAIPAAMGAAAVVELAQRGRGTPFPWDPPERLVVTGPYAYVANPMQLSVTLLMLGVGVLVGSIPVALAGLVAGAFGAGFAHWEERGELEGRFGAAWATYRRSVREWLPTWRPTYLAKATLYYAKSCPACSQVGSWFAQRKPLGLRLRPAECYPGPPLTRITYVAEDGSAFTGVAALARALEHLNLAWAWLGWTLRLPGFCQATQLLVDALGGEPRAIPTKWS